LVYNINHIDWLFNKIEKRVFFFVFFSPCKFFCLDLVFAYFKKVVFSSWRQLDVGLRDMVLFSHLWYWWL